MSVDRFKAPQFSLPTEFALPAPQQFQLSKGSSVFYFPTPGIDAVKLEVIGNSSRSLLPNSHMLIPSFTLQMLQEGTGKLTAQQLAEFFDFHGAEVYPTLSYTQEGLSLLCIKKHLFNLLPALISLFTEATFPEENLAKRKSQRALSLKMDQEKPSTRAGQLFKKGLFGPSHPFGQEITEAHISEITPALLQAYYQNHLWKDCSLFLSGDLTPHELEQLLDTLNQLPLKQGAKKQVLPTPASAPLLQEDRADAVQSSIRLGTWSIPKSHVDFPALAVFNTLLGGYFGSRLVKNIREDKGHTYGIHSSLVELDQYAYWVIAADVKKAHQEEVFEEIEKEIQILRTVLANPEEIEILRNYLIGQLFTKFSSPFDLIDQFKGVYYAGLDFSFYETRFDYLKKFTAADLMSIGNRYFSSSDRVQVRVG
ncbi:MAG: pitrilysin family protein [Bacteroidetes bacterium]|nr:pitrilysin family protein [Bacteroidota bacterium]